MVTQSNSAEANLSELVQQDNVKINTLGKKLAILAKLKGLTQEQLAKQCAVSRISINRFFRGHTEIRAGDLVVLLNILGVALIEMVDRTIEKQISGESNTPVLPAIPKDNS